MNSSIFFKGDVTHFLNHAFGSSKEDLDVAVKLKDSMQPAYADCSALVNRTFAERAKIINGLHQQLPLPIILGELYVFNRYVDMYLVFNRYITLHNQLESEGCRVIFTKIEEGQDNRRIRLIFSEELISTPKGLLIYLRSCDFLNGGSSDYITAGLKKFLEQYNHDQFTPESRLASLFLTFFELDNLVKEMISKTHSVCQTISLMNAWENMKTPEVIVPLQLFSNRVKPLSSRDVKPKGKISSAILQNLIPGIFHSYQTLIPMLSSLIVDDHYIYDNASEMKACFPKVCTQLRALVTNDYFNRQMSFVRSITNAVKGSPWKFNKNGMTITMENYPEHYKALNQRILTLPSFTSPRSYDIVELDVSGARASRNVRKRGKLKKIKDRKFNLLTLSPSSSSSSSNVHSATQSASTTSIPSCSYEIVEGAISATSSTVFSNSSLSFPFEIEEEVNPQVLSSSPLFQEAITPQKKLIMTDRVWRWMRCSPERWEEILCFEDKGMLNYGGCSKEEALFQLGLHGFSPLVDRLIMSKPLRDRFALRTSTGWAVLVDFVYEDGRIVRGLIGWAFCPKSKQCYHRYLERVNNLDILNRKLQDMAEEFTQLPNPELLSQEITVTEESLETFNDGFIGDEVNFDVKTNIFTVMDRKNRIQISAYPLRF